MKWRKDALPIVTMLRQGRRGRHGEVSRGLWQALMLQHWALDVSWIDRAVKCQQPPKMHAARRRFTFSLGLSHLARSRGRASSTCCNSARRASPRLHPLLLASTLVQAGCGRTCSPSFGRKEAAPPPQDPPLRARLRSSIELLKQYDGAAGITQPPSISRHLGLSNASDTTSLDPASALLPWPNGGVRHLRWPPPFFTPAGLCGSVCGAARNPSPSVVRLAPKCLM